MEKTEQQLRFEKEWLGIKTKTIEGDYRHDLTYAAWEGFQLGEASALERAKAEISKERQDDEDGTYADYNQAIGHALEAIRALAQEVGNGN